ncbi:cytosolic carboxypeptidase 2 isoform X3 [Gopherus evgoodei]|uniref:cytosolic carboxypeptidase 2 isoform X3 n=1 Tax=Gopherus evgoodei TaxID=1825980 RepID=UPI0011CFFEA3|nr:cytosolic carboxypeptidase 2 isoform X3 [Gopherus evgoodei]
MACDSSAALAPHRQLPAEQPRTERALGSHSPIGQLLSDPYESFMHHHLQYYGYFRDEEKTAESSSLVLREHRPKSSDSLLEQESGGSNRHSLQDNKKLICSLMLKATLLKSKQLLFNHLDGPGVPRLREPRGLFAVPTSRGPLQAPRWPVECEVIKEQIQHIEWVPPEPEPFYQPTGNEPAPLIVGEEKGTVVYHIKPVAKGSYFTCSRVGGARGPITSPAISLEGPEDTTLLFESRFESGNLQKAVRVGPYEYELTLRMDLYTSKHTQWFYFQVRNTRKGITYRFSIVNLMKPKSLYSMGMKPLLYSQRDAQTRGVGWRREGGDIRYYRCSSEEGQAMYCLTWTVCFPHDHDTCYFAHFYPYTFSDLQRYLLAVASDPVRSQYCKLRVLCSSLAGNTVYLLTITSPSQNPPATAAKKAVVLSARVHPGETNGSWVMRGFLDFILSDSPDAQLLRELFIFKVVPMLNPDGVIVGNYRCSLAGRDLNRNYQTVLKESFPCIWHTRRMIQRVLEEREVLLYCDFHGHSRKNNVFMYGCNNKSTPAQRLHERIFPLMLSKNAPDKFSFHSCKFKVQKSKEGTGRIVMWRMGIPNSYTMESTFSGSTLGRKSDSHFTSEDLKSLGYHICDTLLDFCDPDRSKFLQCLSELQELLQQQIHRKLKDLGRGQDSDGAWSDISLSDIESSTSGSNSSQSDGLPAHLLSVAEKFHQKKKRLRTRKERNELRQKYASSQGLTCQEKTPVAGERRLGSPTCRTHQPVSAVALCMEDSCGKQGKTAEAGLISDLQRREPNASQEEQPGLGAKWSWHTLHGRKEERLWERKCHQHSPGPERLWKAQQPQPLLITMLTPPQPQRPAGALPIREHLLPFHFQLDGEPHGSQHAGSSTLAHSASTVGTSPCRSVWWGPEQPAVTLLLSRNLFPRPQLPGRRAPVGPHTLKRSQSQHLLPPRQVTWSLLAFQPPCAELERHKSPSWPQ